MIQGQIKCHWIPFLAQHAVRLNLPLQDETGLELYQLHLEMISKLQSGPTMIDERVIYEYRYVHIDCRFLKFNLLSSFSMMQ